MRQRYVIHVLLPDKRRRSGNLIICADEDKKDMMMRKDIVYIAENCIFAVGRDVDNIDNHKHNL